LAALQAGDIDAIADVGALQPEQAQVIESDPNLVLLQQGVATSHYLIFSSGKAPFDDVRLRQAVSMALDRDLIVEKTLYNFGDPGVSVITNRAKSWVRTDTAPTYDMDQAIELANEALNGERVEVTLVLSSGFFGRWPYENIGQIIQANLAELGIDVVIESMESGAWSQALKDNNYDMTMTPYTLMTGDPDFFVGRWAHSQGDLNIARNYGYANERIDELVELAITELDPEERKAEYDEVQGILADEVPFTPLYHEITIYATRKNVHDLYLDVQFKPSLETVYIEAE
jgi:peptide/nickel transport system substrate-binding protein